MSEPKEKPKAKLIISIMFSKIFLNTSKYENLIKELKKNFGNILYESDFFEFNFTNFYEKEFGKNLIKKYFYFDYFGKFDIEKLPELKIKTYKLEKQFLNDKNLNDKKPFFRTFNIDVGYLKNNSLVFATFKERAHRIYLKKKVYADLQLVYENNSWKEFKWTFPDIIKNKDFFEKLRIIF